MVALFHIHIIHSRRVCLWIHLQIHPLCNGCVPPLHTHILPPRSPLRHRPHRRNVFLRPRFLGLPSPPNSPRSLLLWSRRRRTLGIRSHWSCSLGIHFRYDWVGGFWRSFTVGELAETRRGWGKETTGDDDGGDYVGDCHFDWYC
jgi:hypothetical protein